MTFFPKHKSLILGMLFLLVLSAVGGGYVWLHRTQPEGKTSPQADSLARQMLKAINYTAWDTTRFVRWTFNDHNYFWDKKRQYVRVEWKNNTVLLNLNKGPVGVAYQQGQPVKDSSRNQQLLQKAWSLYCNDSFWLNAPAKVFDPGTVRKIVPDESDTGLLVTYTKGGVTPGDSYLWHLNENGRPESFQMWVSILPVGGVKVSWEKWQTVSTGAKIATLHQGGPVTIKINNLKTGMTWEDMQFSDDPFTPLAQPE